MYQDAVLGIMDTIPMVVIDEEKEKTLKVGYMTLYTKLFMSSQR